MIHRIEKKIQKLYQIYQVYSNVRRYDEIFNACILEVKFLFTMYNSS